MLLLFISPFSYFRFLEIDVFQKRGI